jgi:hypothetical protein
MKDPKIEELVSQLKSAVDNVNVIMQLLQELEVDVRISYVERSRAKDISQGISLWRIEEHNDYL